MTVKAGIIFHGTHIATIAVVCDMGHHSFIIAQHL
jgi:hypothetical protein